MSMFDGPFKSGSLLHGLSLLVCLLGVIGYAHLAKQHDAGKHRWLPTALAIACILAWLANHNPGIRTQVFLMGERASHSSTATGQTS